jgi:hypothetical protein
VGYDCTGKKTKKSVELYIAGKITAVKPGKCTVFVYARNGLARKVSVKATK